MRIWRKEPEESEAPLSGAPPNRRREKTYSASNGYAYRYVYEGQRRTAREDKPGFQFVFGVSRDRGAAQPVSVFIEERISAPTPTHRYAIAKMALFRMLDALREPDDFGEEIRPDEREAEEILRELNEE